MVMMQGEGTDALQSASHPQCTADRLLLQQLTEAHLQLREQEKVTSQALFDRRILEARVKSLELQHVHEGHSLGAAETPQDMEVKQISDALGETRMGLEDAKVVINKLLEERATSTNAPYLLGTRTEPVARSALQSRRPYVCVIIDGDANHFLPQLLRAGAHGGEATAERLKQEVSKFIAARLHIPHSCTVKLQIFMNRSGFVDTVHKYDQTARNIINACLDRFFQSQPTWDLVDTGGLQESADTKIKANFNFFVDDSDCFAMIMGVCSDKGYVQLLQPFQGDPDRMCKVVLLTSCNTVADIQNLAYAIVQWPTVFRSSPVSYRRCNGLAGPCIKGVTPVENFVQVTSHNFAVASAGRVVKAPSGRQPPKGQVLHLPGAPTGVLSKMGSHPVVSVPPSKPRPSQMPYVRRQQKQRQENNIHDGDLDITVSGECGQESGCTAEISVIANPKNGAQRRQEDQDLSEEPDSRLIHIFDVPKNLARQPVKPISVTRILTSQGNGVVPCPGSLMRMIASNMARQPAFHSSTSSQNPSRRTRSDPTASSHARVQTITAPPTQRLLEQPGESTDISNTSAPSASEPATATSPAPLQQPFIHVPMPDRAQEPMYDPDRFLFQQSPHFLAYNRQTLDTIVSYAKRHYHLTPDTARPRLYRMIEIAEFMISRLWLAQEIQRLEDRAMERQIRCSRPSTFRCGDAWGNDWYLYCSISRALGLRVKAALTRHSNTIARGGLAKMDWVVLMEGWTWKSWRNCPIDAASRRLGFSGTRK